MSNVHNNLINIQKHIEEACVRSNRNFDDVTLIAVTKEVSVERTEEVIQNEILHLGENRPEGLKRKLEAISANVKWHYIGSLQTRKVKSVINEIDYLHSLDRKSLAEEIEKRADNVKNCFVQVNVSEEQSKHGLSMEEAELFIDTLKDYSHIRVVGLMTMAPNTEDKALIRNVFRSLKELQLRIAAKQLPHAPCKELSMGMSGDYEIAIEEGATFIRIGTALVGKDKEDE
ncbi:MULTISPECIES: YggS family pyridoxal phosphate-dependent enzyme [unclassified Psychrobacillus]|uniref:YggS family pyridoxal phosphate-dependent enzyme n=1 Tax=unclassified Psychrobacillus TaxID=2636677 RepID=UPI00146C6A1D|nr:YggS family pyridoxal phosphate-dependent enzyme [Psychrobacillus sp. BL-248-WT-3]NME05250.1 YggS family pyridoxal phosphate-dependent enzyme [Psychrobacillus sp. BL-248-WT-3]